MCVDQNPGRFESAIRVHGLDVHAGRSSVQMFRVSQVPMGQDHGMGALTGQTSPVEGYKLESLKIVGSGVTYLHKEACFLIRLGLS